MGFTNWLRKKKFRPRDFLEPLLAVPFGFPVLRYLSHGFDAILVLVLAGLLFVYLPVVIVVFDWKNRR